MILAKSIRILEEDPVTARNLDETFMEVVVLSG